MPIGIVTGLVGGVFFNMVAAPPRLEVNMNPIRAGKGDPDGTDKPKDGVREPA